MTERNEAMKARFVASRALLTHHDAKKLRDRQYATESEIDLFERPDFYTKREFYDALMDAEQVGRDASAGR